MVVHASLSTARRSSIYDAHTISNIDRRGCHLSLTIDYLGWIISYWVPLLCFLTRLLKYLVEMGLHSLTRHFGEPGDIPSGKALWAQMENFVLCICTRWIGGETTIFNLVYGDLDNVYGRL
jgi:hypothetical protein